MADSVTVGVRVRPLNDRERAISENATPAWLLDDNEITRNLPTASKKPPQTFRYDAIFHPHCHNRQVYDRLAAPVIDAALGGFNATIFAYGQTSSGKTHSMLGDDHDPGITPLAIRHVLSAVTSSRSRNFLIRAVYVEIYNDRIRDLLNPSSADLTVREDKAGRVFVDAEEVLVESFEDAMAALEKGQTSRSVGGTNMNARSSRSHTVFTLHIESKAVEGLDASFRCSSLNLVDLAGSERLKSTGAEGARKTEGAHINKSLVVLGTIINRLSAAGPDPSKIGHLPYRDSKLTRLLRPALGGNAKTAVLCAITPAFAHAEETVSTLKFAERAKKITTNATRNEIVDYRAKYKEVSTEVQVLRQRYAALQAELAEVRANGGGGNGEEQGPSGVEGGDGGSTHGDTVHGGRVRTVSTTQSTTAESRPHVDDSADGMRTPASPRASTSGQTDPSSPPASGSTDAGRHDVDTAREIATTIELRAARDQVNVLKAHVDEMEGQNEHLQARLRVKAAEFTSLRSRAVELRSVARRAKHQERALRSTMAAAYRKLEEARQQLDISRKKGAHVKIAEGYLEELSGKLLQFVRGNEMDGSGASVGGEASERVSVDEGEGTTGGTGAAGEDNANTESGGGGGSSARESMESGRASESDKASGGAGANTASTTTSTTIHVRSGSRRLSERLDGGTWTKRRPRPLPEDMVADIDDSEAETIVTGAVAVESGDEFGVDEEMEVGKNVDKDGGNNSSDNGLRRRESNGGMMVEVPSVRMSDEEADDESLTEGRLSDLGVRASDVRLSDIGVSGDGSGSKQKKKGNRGWRALRSFYGYAEKGVYDKVIGGHKVPSTGNMPA